MTPGPGIFDNDAAGKFVSDLRAAPPTSVGDAVSGALRTVAQAEAPLSIEDVQRALAAVALLLAEADAEALEGMDDAQDIRTWFAGLEIELNPARRQIAEGTLDRILLPDDNGWYDAASASDDGGAAALAGVHRLRDLLADFTAEG
jgi:hypothetical protein